MFQKNAFVGRTATAPKWQPHRSEAEKETAGDDNGGAPTAKAGLTVLLADDHKIIRDAMVPIIMELGPEVEVIQAASLDEVLEIASRPIAIDLMVIDLYMPGMQGIRSLKALRLLRQSEPLAIFSGSIEDSDVKGAIGFGVSAYLPKTMSPKALISAMRLVMNGERYVPIDLYEKCHRNPVESPEGADAHDEPPTRALGQLTPRQFAVLGEVVGGHSNKEIARRLNIQEITVKVHLQAIFRRLEVKTRTQAAMRAVDLGWF